MTRKPAFWLALAEKTGVPKERVGAVRHCLDLLRTGNLPVEKHRATFEHVRREWPKIAPPGPPKADPGCPTRTPEVREGTALERDRPQPRVRLGHLKPRGSVRTGSPTPSSPRRPRRRPSPSSRRARSVVNDVEQDDPP
jgi:hypothetical protein